MILPLLSVLLAVSGATAQWTKVNQPAGTLFKEATLLSDGSWVGVNGSDSGWISTDRGTTWTRFTDEWGQTVQILGPGVVLDESVNDTSWRRRYDAPSGKWVDLHFDRSVVTSDTSKSVGYRWQHCDAGRYQLAIFRSDSVLAFRSTDSGRTWTTTAALPNSVSSGDLLWNSSFAGTRIWFHDTVTKVFRGTADGKNWLALEAPNDSSIEGIADSLADGRWVALDVVSDSILSMLATADSGVTWTKLETTPGLLPGSFASYSENWKLTKAIDSGAERFYVRQASSNAWTLLPKVPGEYWEDFFVDNGLIYSTGDSGLVSLDLGVLGVRGRSTASAAAISWRMEGSDLVVSNTASATSWELRDIAGRNLATGKSAGASELRIPTGDRKGLVLVRLNGTEPRTFSVLAP
jgi:hypothetical protein